MLVDSARTAYQAFSLGTGSLSDGKTTATFAAHGNSSGLNVFRSSGKWYMEATATATGQGRNIGIARSDFAYNSHLGFSTTSYGYGSTVLYNNAAVATYETIVAGDVVAVAFDMINNKLFFRRNGVWQGSANPETNTGGITIGAAAWCPAVSSGPSAGSGSTIWTRCNFGQWNFIYAPPSGFSPFF